jgi:hypothetical protein
MITADEIREETSTDTTADDAAHAVQIGSTSVSR